MTKATAEGGKEQKKRQEMKEWIMLEGNWMERNHDAAGME